MVANTSSSPPDSQRHRRSLWRRSVLSVVLTLVTFATQIPAVSAHGGEQAVTPHFVTKWHGLVVLLVGIAVLVGGALAKRTERLSPTRALGVVFLGIVLASLGAIVFEGLSPDPTYTADSMPFPRAWYTPIALMTGLLTMIVSIIVGITRWPTRPRYTFLGILMGAWILYPELFPDLTSITHPLGYLIVLSTPVLVGYIIWTDAWGVLRAVLQDRVVRQFSLGVAVVATLFFLMGTGYVSFFWEDGGVTETTVVVLPVVYQLVQWPTLEIALPQIPMFIAISPGVVILNGVIGVLVGLNAALIARRWRVNESAGTTEGTAGTAAIVGSCTCGCCGPLVANIATVAVSSTIAAPLYWLFVDSDSPLGVIFVVGAIVLFTGTLVYSARTATRESSSVCAVPAD
jgi:hypothetical protein